VQLNRFSGGRSFRHQLLNQTAPDAGVAILRQHCNVSEHDRRLSPVDEQSPNRAPVQKNDFVVYSRLGSLTREKLHPDKRLLLIVVPSDSFQLFKTRTRINFQQESFVLGRRIAQRQILFVVLQVKSPWSFDLPSWHCLISDANSLGARPGASRPR